jgi:hypothetical protein
MMFDSITGSLSKDYCLYFYILTILTFVSFFFSLIALAAGLFRKKFSIEVFLGLLSAPISLFLAYLGNRLLYNMCISSLR